MTSKCWCGHAKSSHRSWAAGLFCSRDGCGCREFAKATPRMSPAETLLSVQLQQAGIPFEREYRFAPPRRWRADFGVIQPELAHDPTILVEIDGGGYVAGRHSRGAGMEKDAEKQSAAAILGYRVIRLTPKQVEDGRGIQWIKQALGLEKAA